MWDVYITHQSFYSSPFLKDLEVVVICGFAEVLKNQSKKIIYEETSWTISSKCSISGAIENIRTPNFLNFSGGIEMKHWLEMGEKLQEMVTETNILKFISNSSTFSYGRGVILVL